MTLTDLTTIDHARIPVSDRSGFDRYRRDSGVPGPRVVVLGGVHGDETEGMLAAGRLSALPLTLRRGILDVVPVCHEVAAEADHRTSPLDGENLARVFPGAADGSHTERIAWQLTTEVLTGADLLVDLHTSGQHYDMPFLAGYRADASDPDRLGERAARAIGSDFLWLHPHRAEGRTLSVVDVGIYVECPGGGPTDLAYVDAYTAGILRILSLLEMVDEVVPGPSIDPIHVTGSGDLDQAMASVTAGGYFVHEVRRGDRVTAGQRLGVVHTLRGGAVEELHADRDGWVMAVKRRSRVAPGDLVVSLAGDLP